jgi:hypothetical protein
VAKPSWLNPLLTYLIAVTMCKRETAIIKAMKERLLPMKRSTECLRLEGRVCRGLRS